MIFKPGVFLFTVILFITCAFRVGQALGYYAAVAVDVVVHVAAARVVAAHAAAVCVVARVVVLYAAALHAVEWHVVAALRCFPGLALFRGWHFLFFPRV